MKLPVLIAARNEAEHIGNTLRALDYSQVEPIVIDDGSQDATARIVQDNFPGVTLLQLEGWQGKMPALQTAIEHLGRRATEPFATLDADTRPIFSKHWSTALLRARATCDQERPAVIVGSSIYVDHAAVTMAAYRTISEIRLQAKGRRDPDSRGWFGRNTLIHLQNSAAVNRVLELPNYWPREDVALKDAAVRDREAVIGEVYKTPD
ncbi:MAG: glycosyltransferase, partial [Candidatus Saccharimonadales bacterium]